MDFSSQQKHSDVSLFQSTRLLRNAVGQVQLCPARRKRRGERESTRGAPTSACPQRAPLRSKPLSFSHRLVPQAAPWQQWLVNLYCHTYTSQAFLFKVKLPSTCCSNNVHSKNWNMMVYKNEGPFFYKLHEHNHSSKTSKPHLYLYNFQDCLLPLKLRFSKAPES